MIAVDQVHEVVWLLTFSGAIFVAVMGGGPVSFQQTSDQFSTQWA